MQQNNIKILIVDDNEDFAEILQDHLSCQIEFEIVGIAKDGIDAVKLIKEKEPDIVLLDIIMPLLDGLGVIERVNFLNLNKKPQFIILSAVSQDEITQLSLSLGAQFYVVKPFDMDNLVLRIKQIKTMHKQKEFNSNTLVHIKKRSKK